MTNIVCSLEMIVRQQQCCETTKIADVLHTVDGIFTKVECVKLAALGKLGGRY